MLNQAFSKKNRALLSELVRTDFKLRYQGSALGYAWSLLRPLLLFAILYVVFVKVFPLGKGVPHYPVYLLLGLVIWNFFLEMTTQSLGSIVMRGELIRKIRIPRWIIVLSASISALINLFLNLIVVIIFLLLNHVDLLQTTLWLPFIIIEVYILALGCSLWLAAGYVKYRDLNYIWEVIMQMGFYLTPIIYPMTRITSLAIKKLLLLNPMAQAVQDARYAVVTHDTITTKQVFDGGWGMYIPYLLTIVIFIIGLLYFKSQAKNFAENI
jgi:ABC-2 type transport system permease protein